MKVVEVAVGLVYHGGRYLIARRRSDVHLAGFWEFPGGKREAGESLEECLRRELFEELSIRVDSPVPYQTVRHDYPDRIVELHFFRCSIEQGDPTPIDCAEVRWVRPEELAQFTFPPADHAILRALERDAMRTSG